jgi:hypothetical protein
MTSRETKLIGYGALLLLAVFCLRPILIDALSPEPWVEGYQEAYSGGGSAGGSGYAPVSLWWEQPLGERNHWRAGKAVRLVVRGGVAFESENPILLEKLTSFLNERIDRDQVKYVVVFPVAGTKWGELIPVIDQCRKSRVEIVLLNQFDT